eukprot:6183445-Prymnesium_polylepis.1
MFTARVASELGGRICATARKSWCSTPTFFTFTPPAPQGPKSEGGVRACNRNPLDGGDPLRGG